MTKPFPLSADLCTDSPISGAVFSIVVNDLLQWYTSYCQNINSIATGVLLLYPEKFCERGVCMWSEKLFYPGYLELAEIVHPFLLGAKRKIVIAAFNDDH